MSQGSSAQRLAAQRLQRSQDRRNNQTTSSSSYGAWFTPDANPQPRRSFTSPARRAQAAVCRRHRLVEAAFDLGADKRRAMSRVILPLAAPGIAAGCILVFIPCLGAYVTPELLGGGKFMMIANLIGSQFGAARNWPLGAGLGFVLLALVLISMMVYSFKFKSLPEESR